MGKKYIRHGGFLSKKTEKIISLIFLSCFVILLILSWNRGLFRSPEAMRDFISRHSGTGIAIFILFQAGQVVIPFLPAGVGYLSGVLLFGAGKGFLLNYIAVCLGCMIAFAIGKTYGKPVLNRIFGSEKLKKYEHWNDEKGHFLKLFVISLFIPGAPDDFLCYLAGTTEMTAKRFLLIILLLKPFKIAIYCFVIATAATEWGGMGKLIFR